MESRTGRKKAVSVCERSEKLSEYLAKKGKRTLEKETVGC